MAHITFIHGLANKPPKDRLPALWEEALRRDDPRPDVFPSPNNGLDPDTDNFTYEMVYWADVLYEKPDPDESGYGLEARITDRILEGVPATAREARAATLYEFDTTKLPSDELAAVESMRRQMGLGQEFSDDHEPTNEEIEKAKQGDYKLERIPLPWVVKEQIISRGFLRDAHHYMFNIESTPRAGETYKVRDELQARLIAALKRGSSQRGPHVVVSHSMGTMIAYDVLMNLPDCPAIDGFITLGSPLGLDEVQDKLKAPGLSDPDYPSETLHGEWVNIFDRLDPIAAFDPYLANDYKKDGREVIKDINEQNWGKWRHSIQKYLSGSQFRTALRHMLFK